MPFHVENIPNSPFLVIPEASSERRRFIPMGYMRPDTLCSNLVKIACNASLYHLGVLGSTMRASYGKKSFASDAERVAFLFELYQKYTSLLPGDSKPRKSRRARGE